MMLVHIPRLLGGWWRSGTNHLAYVLLIAALVSCSRTPPDATPEGAVRELIERMERMDGDPERARAAYELLSSTTRANLIERAKRASSATGRPIPPEQMLAPSRFVLLFRPQQMQARTEGDRAIVEVLGADPASDQARIPLVREEGLWRIELGLPELAPVERRRVQD